MLASHPTLGAELVAAIPFDRLTARGEDADEFGAYLPRSGFHRAKWQGLMALVADREAASCKWFPVG